MSHPVNEQSAVMTSLEISELVDKRHDNVKRTIETLIEKGVIASPQIEEKPTAGRPVSAYVFEGEQGKRDSIVVVAQLSPEFTARLVDRWQELEKQINQPAQIPQTFAEALRLAADLEEQKAQLEGALAIAGPKADFVDHYVEAKGLMTFRQVAKVLQVKENYLSAFLMDNGIMYRLRGKLTAHQNHIHAGRFATKTGENEKNQHAYVQTYFTPKGVHWLAGLLASDKLRDAV
jgi:phage antirepressor YoqD-like protein